jgi:hypothetical protein
MSADPRHARARGLEVRLERVSLRRAGRRVLQNKLLAGRVGYCGPMPRPPGGERD